MNGRLSRQWRTPHDSARPWTPPPVPTVVLVPHPDDEVLIFGGLIARQVDSGVDVTVIAVTDGEAAYSDADPRCLASVRRSEQCNALRTLAKGSITTVHLGLPDGDVAANTAALIDVVAQYCDEDVLVAAPWTLDHHCDHEALGRVAARAVERGAGGHSGALLVYGLFWAWHHRSPNDLNAALLMLELDADIQQRKHDALRCHGSQLDWPGGEPILSPAVLEPLSWPAEYYLNDAAEGRPQ